jgi:hypothetical protein
VINAASSGGSQYPFLIASFPTTISSTSSHCAACAPPELAAFIKTAKATFKANGYRGRVTTAETFNVWQSSGGSQYPFLIASFPTTISSTSSHCAACAQSAISWTCFSAAVFIQLIVVHFPSSARLVGRQVFASSLVFILTSQGSLPTSLADEGKCTTIS